MRSVFNKVIMRKSSQSWSKLQESKNQAAAWHAVGDDEAVENTITMADASQDVCTGVLVQSSAELYTCASGSGQHAGTKQPPPTGGVLSAFRPLVVL